MCERCGLKVQMLAGLGRDISETRTFLGDSASNPPLDQVWPFAISLGRLLEDGSGSVG